MPVKVIDSRAHRDVQGVAVNWIFSFRIKFCGFQGHFGGVGGGRRELFLTFWMVTGRVTGRSGSL